MILGCNTTYEVHPDDIREAIANHLKAKYGVEVEPKFITEFGGVEIDKFLVARRRDSIEPKEQTDAGA